MASNHTTNYNLNQWEATDKVLRTEFNADNAKIDAALKTNADAIAANAAELGEHAASLLTKGNCQIYHASYAGDGNTSRTFAFPGVPLIVWTTGPYFQMMAMQGNANAWTLEGGNHWGMEAVWSGNSLTLNYLGTFAGGDSKMGNEVGSTYYIVALMAMDE